MRKQTLTAFISQEGKFYIAENPETGVVSQGKTMDESLSNLKEAVELYLEEFPLKQTKKPFVTIFEVSVHA